MARLMVRLFDQAENKYDFFEGEPANCPPLPRIGDHIEYHLGKGKVEEVLHIYENLPGEDVYRIAIKVKLFK